MDFESHKKATEAIDAYNGRKFMGITVECYRITGIEDIITPVSEVFRLISLPPEEISDEEDKLETENIVKQPEPVSEVQAWKKAHERDVHWDTERLYVGRLPRFDTSEDGIYQVMEIFSRARVPIMNVTGEVLGRRIGLLDQKQENNFGCNNYHCFVSIIPEYVDAAIQRLNGLQKWGGNITVSRAKTTSLMVRRLPNFSTHTALEARIKRLFEGFEVKACGKLERRAFRYHIGTVEENFCAVELATEAQMDQALMKFYGEWAGFDRLMVKPYMYKADPPVVEEEEKEEKWSLWIRC